MLVRRDLLRPVRLRRRLRRRRARGRQNGRLGAGRRGPRGRTTASAERRRRLLCLACGRGDHMGRCWTGAADVVRGQAGAAARWSQEAVATAKDGPEERRDAAAEPRRRGAQPAAAGKPAPRHAARPHAALVRTTGTYTHAR